jgi:transposase
MRGGDGSSGNLFSYVDLEARVPADHPLRTIRGIVNDILVSLSPDFEGLYSRTGRPSIPPEKLLRALLLQAFFTVRSERQLMEQLEYNLLFRWFVGLGMDDAVWDASTFCKNRDRLLEAEISAKLLTGVIEHGKVRRLLSREHFSVDGTLIEAWASMKSFRPKDGGGDDGSGPGRTPEVGSAQARQGRNQERDFHGEKFSNETHESTTDPEARLYRKGNSRESRLCYTGHAFMENRHGMAVGGGVTLASGMAEREEALEMIDRHRPMEKKGGKRRITVGGDKGYDVAEFVEDLRARKVTPHIAVQDHLTKTGKRRKTKIDGRTTRHAGYDVSQRCRKRIEEIFGWIKVQGGQTKTKFRGRRRVEASFILALAAYNLIRLPKLLGATP